MIYFFILLTLIICSEASTSRSPYIVAVLNKGKFTCSGAIIHEEFIVTLASCVSGIELNEVSIRAGSEKRDVGGVIGQVEKVIIHPKYDVPTRDYDVAVLKLKGCLAVSRSNIKAISISSKHIKIKEGLVSGWTLNEAGSLKFYKVKIFHRTDCNQITGENITKHMLCAEKTKAEQCIDISSGSPLVAEGKLIGIVSFAYQCNQNLPVIYSNIPALSNFMQGTLKRFAGRFESL